MSTSARVAIAGVAVLLVACGGEDGSGGPAETSIPAVASRPSDTVPPPTISSVADPPSTTGVEAGSPYDPDATMRSDLMVVEPAAARPGEGVTVTYPGGRERGVAYALERLRDGNWHTTFLMTAAVEGDGQEPTWALFPTENYGWIDVGNDGPGPDRLRIPDALPAGAYRICTANSAENICAEVTIEEPDDSIPFHTGTSAPVAELLGLPLDEFTAGVVELGFGPVRVVWRDGEHLAVHDDLQGGRVDVAVEQRDGVDVVIDARVEADTDSGWLGAKDTIVDVFDDVGFYPACGNESLEYRGVIWYQVQRAEYPEIFERAANGYRENVPEDVTVRGFAPQGFAPRVAEPGPGDDVGTLVVWSDDVAYFVSDSGNYWAWLVQKELTYPWEC